jgi:hypothetical protein
MKKTFLIALCWLVTSALVPVSAWAQTTSIDGVPTAPWIRRNPLPQPYTLNDVAYGGVSKGSGRKPATMQGYRHVEGFVLTRCWPRRKL